MDLEEEGVMLPSPDRSSCIGLHPVLGVLLHLHAVVTGAGVVAGVALETFLAGISSSSSQGFLIPQVLGISLVFVNIFSSLGGCVPDLLAPITDHLPN